MKPFPLLYADYPDPDIIRVDRTYYMISTTMHFFPGGEILKSPDLIHWEPCCHVFDTLGDLPSRHLEGGHIYGKGMWAGSLRYHNGLFHLLFACNETQESCHYVAEKAEGPWVKKPIQGFFYDCSLFFDDDDRVYIVHGNRTVRLTEMEKDLSRKKEGGLDRILLEDSCEGLGFEGNHMYKVRGQYYLFSIHWPQGHMRTEACHRAQSLTSEFAGGDLLEDDLGFHQMGVAQGGIVDTPDGKWFLFLFQDRGAAGRMPVLLPMEWNEGQIVIHKDQELPDFPQPALQPLTANESFLFPEPLIGSKAITQALSPNWQWNHEPNWDGIALTENGLQLTTLKVTNELEMTPNMLTQRTVGIHPSYEVTVDAANLKEGDRAGLLALQGCFAALAIEKIQGRYRLLRLQRKGDPAVGTLWNSCEEVTEEVITPLSSPVVKLRLSFDFEELKDTVELFYWQDENWQKAGDPHQLLYRLDHFTGVRPALFVQSRKEAGGSVCFRHFVAR